MYWSIRCVVWWVVVWYQVVNYLSKSKLKTIIKIGSTDQSKTWNLKVKKLMYSSNKNLVECWCSITKVNGNKNLKFLIDISLFYFFSCFAINSFIYRFAVALDLVFVWMKYITTTLQIGNDWDQLSFLSISHPILWKGYCCYVIGLLWTWNRCFVVTKHLC